MRVLATVLAALALASCGRGHAVEDCSTQSGAEFPGAFTSRANLVVGPFALSGGAYTDPETVREFGGNKFPVLVQAGHTVTLALPPDARTIAGLAYGLLPQGETKMRDTYSSVTFIACRRGKSRSRGGGFEVTFWSGSVLTRKPVCLPLDVSIDGAPPRRAVIALGARC
jgi:hypothetical protein